MIDAGSLSQTVDAVNAAVFDRRPLAANERKQVARWIASRQGLPGAYAETFAGFAAEREKGIVVFTGFRGIHLAERQDGVPALERAAGSTAHGIYARRRYELAVRALGQI